MNALIFRALLILTAIFVLLFLGEKIIFPASRHIVSEHKNVAVPLPPDPASLSWVLATSSASWTPRDSHAVFEFADKLWVVGGLDGNRARIAPGNIEYWKADYHTDIWHSLDGLSWEQATGSVAFLPRRSMTIVPFQGTLFSYGGWSPTRGYQTDLWTSPDGFSWTRATTSVPWGEREGFQIVEWNETLWMMGGVNYATRTTFNDVWQSSDGFSWTQIIRPTPWATRWDHAVTVHHGKLFLAGGMNLAHDFFNDVWVTDNGLTWEQATTTVPWAPRQGHGLLSYKDTLWVMGRLNDKPTDTPNDVWFSTDDGYSWKKTLSDPLWQGREDFGAILFKDAMWILGGMDTSWHWRNDVWKAAL